MDERMMHIPLRFGIEQLAPLKKCCAEGQNSIMYNVTTIYILSYLTQCPAIEIEEHSGTI